MAISTTPVWRTNPPLSSSLGSNETPSGVQVNVKISVATSMCLTFAVALAASSCAKTTAVGTSGKPKDSKTLEPRGVADAGESPERAAPKFPSVISAKSDDSIITYPILGDVNGDGFDDFFVQSISLTPPMEEGAYYSKVYLYYGRPVFPPQLTTEDADAVFTADSYTAWPLGDINGDQLADFSIGVRGGTALVFGSTKRYSGTYASGAAGVIWTGKPYPDSVSDAGGINTLSSVRSAGDVNGDGISDLIVSSVAMGDGAAFDNSMFDFQMCDYLVLGHPEEWVAGEWDPSSAAAVFGSHSLALLPGNPEFQPFQPFSVASAGDLDGDGFSDLFAQTEQSTFVFYGGAELKGELGPERADARLELKSGCDPYVLGDLDGDGRGDLGSCSGSTIDVIYGTNTRWSGTQTVDTDFRLEIPVSGGALLTAAAGDTDADGAPELVISAVAYRQSAPDVLEQLRFLYTVRGTGERLTGTHVLSDAEGTLGPTSDLGVISPRDLATRFPGGGASVLSLAGDLDGDGSNDILADGSHGAPPESGGAITLIPSTPRAPD